MIIGIKRQIQTPHPERKGLNSGKLIDVVLIQIPPVYVPQDFVQILLCDGLRRRLRRGPWRSFRAGPDGAVRWDDYEGLMQQARRWLGDLPPAAARRIGWENGAALFGLPVP